MRAAAACSLVAPSRNALNCCWLADSWASLASDAALSVLGPSAS